MVPYGIGESAFVLIPSSAQGINFYDDQLISE
jgi:hypothetical protein